MSDHSIYRISFLNQGNIYQLHARSVDSSNLYAFVEVADILFGERSEILVDPSEEKLKAEFEGVKRTYIPMHAVIRIDEVSKEGQNRIVGTSEGATITPFPMPLKPKGRE
ncbi:DUF1820 family protein [Thiorhodococcus fuscus]|uniref:DUF1820 family protein n=1 Tax=Thiorhodococcus fuscus TaxID=527200 RepID=A0ABW4Y776_9GAMM